MNKHTPPAAAAQHVYYCGNCNDHGRPRAARAATNSMSNISVSPQLMSPVLTV